MPRDTMRGRVRSARTTVRPQGPHREMARKTPDAHTAALLLNQDS
jgi:hypothetical protein